MQTGPWDDYAAPPEEMVATELPVETALAPVATDDAGPWAEFAEPEAGGELGEDSSPAIVPTRDPEQFRVQLKSMLESRAPRADIDDFLSSSGFSLDPEIKEWMDLNYDAWTSESAGDVEWDVEDPKQREEVGALSSVWSGAKSGALRGWDDELEAFSGAAGNKLGTMLGLNESTDDFWDIYETLQEKNEQYKNEAYEQNTLAYGAGFLPGMLTGPTIPALARPGAVGKIDKLKEAMTIGAAEGMVSGAGNSDDGLVNRLGGAATGGTIGAAFAPVALPLGHVASTMGRRIAERVGPRPANSLNSGLDALVARAPQNADDMTARGVAMAEAGVPPRLVDVVDESGRGVIRDAASKMTPARQEIAEHADAVYASAQDRVAQQARNNISPAPRTGRDIGAEIAREQTEMGAQFDIARNEVVELTPELIQVFGTVQGRTALGTVAKYMTAPEQEALRKFAGAVKNASSLDPQLPEPVRQQVMQQLMADSPLTVDIADKFARVVRRLGKDDGMMRPANDMANAVRGAARQQHPAYDDALIAYEKLANVGDAAAGTGKFEGEEFMRSAPDDYARTQATASDETITIDMPEGPVTYPSERTVSAVRARDEVVDAATSGSGARAMGVAKQISRGSAQKERNRTLLGEEGAGQLERGMAEEFHRVEHTAYVDPRRGSQTQGRQQDADVDEIMNFAADSAAPGMWGAVRGVARWFRSKGIRGVDAERLVRDAISEDPRAVEELVDYMVQKGISVSKSRSVVRAAQAAAAGRSAGVISGDSQPRVPANSVRAVLRESQR